MLYTKMQRWLNWNPCKKSPRQTTIAKHPNWQCPVCSLCFRLLRRRRAPDLCPGPKADLYGPHLYSFLLEACGIFCVLSASLWWALTRHKTHRYFVRQTEEPLNVILAICVPDSSDPVVFLHEPFLHFLCLFQIMSFQLSGKNPVSKKVACLYERFEKTRFLIIPLVAYPLAHSKFSRNVCSFPPSPSLSLPHLGCIYKDVSCISFEIKSTGDDQNVPQQGYGLNRWQVFVLLEMTGGKKT